MKKDRVSWRIATAIWWAQFWRACLVTTLFFAGALFTASAFAAAKPQTAAGARAQLLGQCVGYLIGAAIQIWAMREALVNRYKSFGIKIANRAEPGQNVLSPRGRVRWRIAAAVWWAQFWRYYLTLSLIGLIMGAVWVAAAAVYNNLHGGPHAAAAPQSPMLAVLLGILMMVFLVSILIWALRESLVNDYKLFTLKITDRKPAAD